MGHDDHLWCNHGGKPRDLWKNYKCPVRGCKRKKVSTIAHYCPGHPKKLMVLVKK